MTTINHCRKGEELARIIPENPGENGYDVYGQAIKPREVKHATLKFGRNIELSEDKHVIRSMVDGHVTLVDDKVFVSDVYEVKNVDVSTGNIEFDGSIEISGNVVENFEVKAGGNVIINGLAEVLNIFPIFVRRIKLIKCIPFLILGMALGKGIGAIWYFYMRW